MVVIQGTLIDENILQKNFACDLNACKGACCWEGDLGAPLDKEELPVLEEIYEEVKPYLTQEGLSVIEKEGLFVYDNDEKEYGTPLVNGGPCAYMTYDNLGIARCGIESAYLDGKISFKKPISCHLYPIRVVKNHQQNLDVLRYSRWSICSAACTKGDKEQIRIYEFVKDALIRKYGEQWYEELKGAAKYLEESDE